MFKIQTLTETYNHNLKNISIDKKYILRKMSLKFQNPKLNVLYKIEINTLLLNVNP